MSSNCRRLGPRCHLAKPMQFPVHVVMGTGQQIRFPIKPLATRQFLFLRFDPVAVEVVVMRFHAAMNAAHALRGVPYFDIASGLRLQPG